MLNQPLNSPTIFHRYQVFLFACPASIPVNFASHPWFVLNKKGEISRWEVSFRTNACKTSWGHLNLNLLSPFQGIEILPISHRYFWKSRLLGQIDGEIAKKMIEFIENSPATYPYCDKYFLSGPNSNTYAKWILNAFPEFKVTLPWNYFGKNYRIK